MGSTSIRSLSNEDGDGFVARSFCTLESIFSIGPGFERKSAKDEEIEEDLGLVGLAGLAIVPCAMDGKTIHN